MSDARERLSRLIELASESTPEKQRALAFELCDLLSDWPERYPPAMREPFEALLAKVLQRLDSTTRRMIVARLAMHPDAALSLLYEFYADMPLETREGILLREGDAAGKAPALVEVADEISLVESARGTCGADFAAVFARFLGIPPATARRIVDDSTGNALAVACRGAHVRRATYSALALLAHRDWWGNPDARYTRLAAFETIPEHGAECVVAFWQRASEVNVGADAGAEAA
jgi:Uncharacterised protein conserved in bacteria (DUF2336)